MPPRGPQAESRGDVRGPRRAIVCEGLTRIYSSRSLLGGRRETVALDDLSLDVPEGAVFGLLGPNGAGKTTAVRILSTLLTPTRGTARVMGYDVVREAGRVRREIGLILGGERGLYLSLTGRENLIYFAALHHMSPREAGRSADRLLEQVGLAEGAHTRVEEYSRGMRQRLHVARGLMTDPPLLFMDEPTIGLDPMGAQEVRSYIPQLVDEGKTVLLTTHYMFEADALCDTIAMIDKGKLVALGTPSEIKRIFSRMQVVELTLSRTRAGLQEEIARLDGVQRVDAAADGLLSRLTVQVDVGVDLTTEIAQTVGQDAIESIVARDPTLEEAYLNILR